MSVIHLPRPYSADVDEIARGRFRALQQYQEARTDEERYAALVWVNHWRTLWDHVQHLRRLGASR